MMNRFVKGLVVNLALATTSTLLALAGAELFLSESRYAERILPFRLRYQDAETAGEAYLQKADDIPFTTRPGYHSRWSTSAGSITINSQGFRVSRAHGGRVYDQVDVLCMGDSFTFGYLVDDDDTYPARLAQLYAPSAKTVVNAGYTGGLSFDSAGLRYRNSLARLRPSVVVYGVFPGNDFEDLAVWTRVSSDGAPVTMRTANQIRNEGGYSVPLLRESRLFMGLSQAWCDWWHRPQLAGTLALRWERVSDAVRRFREATAPTGTRLIFVFLREPGTGYAQYVADRDRVPLAVCLASVEDDIRRMKGVLDTYQVEWHDDKDVIESVRVAIATHQLPELPGVFKSDATHLTAQASSHDWNPGAVCTSDGVHYSAITNAYVAAWIHGLIEESK